MPGTTSPRVIAPKRIVVFAPRFIGDMVNAGPALQILVNNHPQAEIYIVARPYLAPVCTRLGDFFFIADERKSHKAKGVLQLIDKIKRAQCDIAVLLTNTFIDAAIVRLAGVPIRIGYKNEGRSFLLTQSLRKNPNRHYINRYAYLANEVCRNAEKLLPSSMLRVSPFVLPETAKTTTLALYFGCESKTLRFYPLEATIQLLDRLSCSYSVRFVIIGASNENEAAQRMIEQLSSDVECVNLCGKTALEEMIDVIAATDGVITIDSSPLHIASALNKPLVVLEGQGFSAFSCIQPKNKDAWVASSQWQFINDEDQVLDIPVEHIEQAVAQMMKAIDLLKNPTI